MLEERERTKELVGEAYELAERSKALRAQIVELTRKSARIREATKKLRDDLDRNGKKKPQNT